MEETVEGREEEKVGIDYSDYVASGFSLSLPLSSSLSVSPRGLSSPATLPLGPSLSTSCPLLRKSMRPARPLLNPVTHDWNIPRFSAFIRDLFIGTRFYPPLSPLPQSSRYRCITAVRSLDFVCVCVCMCARARAPGDSIRRVDGLVVLGLVEKLVAGRPA